MISTSLDYDRCWPFEAEQRQKLGLLAERLSSWKPLISELIHYFQLNRINYEKSYKDTTKLAQTLIPRSSADPHSQITASKRSFKEFAEKFAQHNIDMARAITAQIIKPLKNIKAENSRKAKEFARNIQTQLSVITKERGDTFKLIQGHVLPEGSVESLSADYQDPWLSEKVILQHVDGMANSENEHRRKIAQIMEQVKQYEADLVKSFADILSKFMELLRYLHDDQQSTLIEVQKPVLEFENGKLYDDFAKNYGLFNTPCFAANMKPEDFPFPYERIHKGFEVVRSGKLKRPGTWRKTLFRPSMMALSENGVFHCFVVKGVDESLEKLRERKSRLLYSINLKQPKVDILESKTDEKFFEIIVPASGGMFGKKKQVFQFEAQSGEEAKEWISDLERFLSKNRDMPEIEEKSK